MPVARIAEFDTWKPGYGGAAVYIYRAGTTTLANVYTDEGLQAAALNPQTLLQMTKSGVEYGKFLVPLYTEQAYYLRINQIDDTGIERPSLTGLEGEDAVRLDGARATYLHNCWWAGNTVNLSVDDGAILNTTNSVIDLTIQDGRFIDGEIDLEGTLDSVVFRRVVFEQVDVTLTLPLNNVVAQDCSETTVTLAGVATAWTRGRSNNRGASAGLTTGNAATKAWAIGLDPGQRVYLEGKVIGRGRNVNQDGFYHIAVSAWRPLAELDYDTQTGNFTAGNIVTGATSGATARIVADSDAGTTGTLGLQDVSGTFLDNEIVSDGGTGSATVNGVIAVFDAALLGTVAALRAAQETNANWAAAFVGNGTEIELRVTGDTAQSVEWTVDVEVVST